VLPSSIRGTRRDVRPNSFLSAGRRAALPRFHSAVIPAKAGIYFASHRKCGDNRLDSRFRGNDRRFEKGPIPNDTTTGSHKAFHNESADNYALRLVIELRKLGSGKRTNRSSNANRSIGRMPMRTGRACPERSEGMPML
jgi:hypothetical protein